MRAAGLALLAVLLAVWAGCRIVRSADAGDSPGVGELAQFGAEEASGAAPPSPLCEVEVGMSVAQVESIAGSPVVVEQKGSEGQLEVWYYEGGVVILRGGEVRFNFPVSAPGG